MASAGAGHGATGQQDEQEGQMMTSLHFGLKGEATT
jgi:hypothetical protein